MKRIIIVIFLIVPFFSFGQSDTVKITSDSLTEKQMDSLQLNVIQKLRMFYNCISIMTNADYHQEFRDEAVKRAKKAFYGADCSVDGKIAAAYVDSCSQITNGLKNSIDDIVVKGYMKKIVDVLGDENYQGMLTYMLTVGKDPPVSKKAYITFSRKTQGDPTIKPVWAVFICDIR